MEIKDKNTIDKIKSAFCNLTHFKKRENALEVITAYPTLNNKFVSVFITFTNNKIVLTDSGWIDQNYYDTPLNEENEDIIDRVKGSFKSSYNVKSTIDKGGVEFFYKTCTTIEEIPTLVFDLANFIVGVVNAFCTPYRDEKEEREKETFKKDANTFLRTMYLEKVMLRQGLDDYKTIRFNAIINKNSNLYLITYVTGSSQYYFENDLRKSIVNYEIAAKSMYSSLIKEKITLINDQSEGYNPEKSGYIIQLLNEKTTREPIKWSEKEKVLDLI